MQFQKRSLTLLRFPAMQRLGLLLQVFMADLGVYIHIPFCRSQCPFCDFSITTRRQLDAFVHFEKQLLTEMVATAPFWQHFGPAKTVFFGGGTPSWVEPAMITRLLERLQKIHGIDPLAEITLECNPEDVTAERVKQWQDAGVNRFSVGLQSMQDEELAHLGRVHRRKDNQHALDCLRGRSANNISVDFMFGTHPTSSQWWQDSFDQVMAWQPEHISTYELTIEPNTVFYKQVQHNALALPTEDAMATQFFTIKQALENHQYRTYEISNAARNNRMALHNLHVWQGGAYWGLGPSAHGRWSKGQTYQRIVNPKTFTQYIQTPQAAWLDQRYWTELPIQEWEQEQVLTQLRLDTGICYDALQGFSIYDAGMQRAIDQGIEMNHLQLQSVGHKMHLCLTSAQRIYADGWAQRLLIDGL